MKRKSKRLLVALVLIGVLAAGGAAFTAANSLPPTTAGYGTSTITGATADKIVYHLSADGTQINSVTVDLHTASAGDLTSGYTVQAGFETNSLTGCTVDATYGTNGYDSTAGNTQFTCSGYTETTSTSSSFNVAVTNS
jgi:hypothetical protein